MPREPFDNESDESSIYGPLGAGHYDPDIGLFSDEYDTGQEDPDFTEAFAEEFGEYAVPTATPDEAEDAAPYPSPPSLDDALTTSVPIMLVNRPHRNYDAVSPLLRVVSRAQRSDVVLGASVSLLRIGPKNGDKYLRGCSAASLRIADPMTFASRDHVHGRTAAASSSLRWPYQELDTLTSHDDETWIAEVVAAQRVAGANLILSSGRYLPGDEPSRELDVAIRHAEISAGLTGVGEASAMNLTMAGRWLTHDSMRDELLARLVEHAPRVVYARVLWPQVDTAAQPLDAGMLAGYRELCEVTASEGIRLLLPNTDLTGWLALAWGAAGFGTGITAEARAFTPSRLGGGAGTPAKERIMEGALLHTVLRDEHQRMLILKLVQGCDCTYCRMATAGRPWTPEIQGCHHVCALAAVTAALAATPLAPATGRAAQVSAMVSAAQELHARIIQDIALDKGSIPKHLAVWSDALS